DVSKEPNAEEKFKEVAESYETLKDRKSAPPSTSSAASSRDRISARHRTGGNSSPTLSRRSKTSISPISLPGYPGGRDAGSTPGLVPSRDRTTKSPCRSRSSRPITERSSSSI